MAFEIENKLVVAVASSALFDLSDSDEVFKRDGESAYRTYQREHETKILSQGVVFPLVKRLLHLRDQTGNSLIEVVLFSRNDPDTGLRVFNSIEHYQLPISRAVFVAGKNPFHYLTAFNASLFLSGNKADVDEAIAYGLPAGYVSPTNYQDDETDEELRLAFDFDGIIAGDESEQIYRKSGIDTYKIHEKEHANKTMNEGPLFKFLKGLSEVQKIELAKKEMDTLYKPKVRIAVCTARNAPAHERVIKTLREWEIRVDEAFFLGGIDKTPVLEIYQPHIFFDDQKGHVQGISSQFPSVHVPYGIANERTKQKDN